MKDAVPFEIVTDVPLALSRSVTRSPHVPQFEALAASEAGASMFLPWALHDQDPEKEAAHWGRMAYRHLGKGCFAVRRVEAGFRVWKKASE